MQYPRCQVPGVQSESPVSRSNYISGFQSLISSPHQMYNFRSRSSMPFRSALTQPLNVRSGLQSVSFEADVTTQLGPAGEQR